LQVGRELILKGKETDIMRRSEEFFEDLSNKRLRAYLTSME